MKYIVSKKQVEEMYNEIKGMWRFYKDNIFSLVLYRSGKRIEWTFVKGDGHIPEWNIIFQIDNAIEIFEWVILKEIGGRKTYTKKEIIDGIQWSITNNYNKL